MSSVRAIPVSHTEALNLVRTWKAKGALIRIEFRFRILIATFRARVADVSDAQLTFVSDDKLAELVLPVPLVATFQYLDLRESLARDLGRMLVLLYPFVPDPNESDQVVFAEIVEKPPHVET